MNNKTIVDINFLSQEEYSDAVRILHERYPTNQYEIGYVYSPFTMGYCVGFGLIEKDGGLNNTLLPNTPERIYGLFAHHFKNYTFDEQDRSKLRFFEYGGDQYPQYDKLFNFLVANGYSFPKERIARYSENPFTKSRVYYQYNIDGSPVTRERLTEEQKEQINNLRPTEDELNSLRAAFYEENETN